MTNQCCGTSGCCSPESSSPIGKRLVTVDFLYLDLGQCDWCQGTEENLEAAIVKLSEILRITGVELVLNKIHVVSEQQAETLSFTTSPTIRVNGKDIQFDYKETQCTACSDLCGEDVECRTWLYQGKEYTTPPEGLIIEIILKEVFGNIPSAKVYTPKQRVPLNLKKFFKGIKNKD